MTGVAGTCCFINLSFVQTCLQVREAIEKDPILSAHMYDQLRYLTLDDARSSRWSPEFIKFCLEIYCHSQSLYNKLRDNYRSIITFPDGSTMARWVRACQD